MKNETELLRYWQDKLGNIREKKDERLQTPKGK